MPPSLNQSLNHHLTFLTSPLSSATSAAASVGHRCRSAVRGYYQTDNENRYHVVVGPQVDATLVVAMAFAIDEVHDEENAAEAKKEEEQMVHLGYPGAT